MQKKEIVFNVKTLTDLQESSENTEENPQHAYIIKEFVFNCNKKAQIDKAYYIDENCFERYS